MHRGWDEPPWQWCPSCAAGGRGWSAGAQTFGGGWTVRGLDSHNRGPTSGHWECGQRSRKAPQARADRLGQDGAGLATRGQGVIWAGQLRSEVGEAGRGREGPVGTLSVILLGDCPRLLQQEDKAWRPKHKVWRCSHVSGA